MQHKSAISDEGVQLDATMYGFGGAIQKSICECKGI